MRASTLWWQDAHPNDERLWIAPHIAAPFTSADDRAGRDTALEAVLAYTPQLSLTDVMRAAFPDGKSKVAAAFKTWRDDPQHRYLSGEEELIDLAVALYGEKKAEAALWLFEINAEAHPSSWRAHESLGRAYQAAGRNEEAIAEYKRAIALSDKAVVARERLTILQAER